MEIVYCVVRIDPVQPFILHIISDGHVSQHDAETIANMFRHEHPGLNLVIFNYSVNDFDQ